MRAKYVLSEVFLGLWRNVTMTVAMIITMAVSLALLGAGVLMYWKVQDMRTFFYGSVEVSIFLKPDITDSQQTALKDQLAQDPLVKETNYESKGTAYKRFQEQLKDAKDFVNSVKPDSLPASFRVKLKDPQKFGQIAEKYRNKPGVDSIVDQQQTLDKIFNILGAIQNLALIIAIVQGLAALMLVANTIQV